MGRRGAPKKSDLFGQELIVGKGLVLLVPFPVVFYKALRSKLVYPDQASAAGYPCTTTERKTTCHSQQPLSRGVFKRPDVRAAYQVAKDPRHSRSAALLLGKKRSPES